MKIPQSIFRLAIGIMILAMSAPLVLADHEGKKIEESDSMLREIMSVPERGIPPVLLHDAQGIAIFPSVVKIGFIFGGRHGSGILMVNRGEKGWSNPLFVSITGGSVGFQIGAEATDLILVFKTRKSIDTIVKGKFTLGADATVAAGPVGRAVQAATDIQLRAEIYSFSRSRGLFAGVSLEGAALLVDEDGNENFYTGKKPTAYDILYGNAGKENPAIKSLHRLLP